MPNSPEGETITRIKQVKQGPATILTVESPLRGSVTKALQDKLHACLEAGELYLVLDFQQVPFIDSAALGILVTHSRLARSKGGAIKIAHVTEMCHQTFVVTRLDQLLEFYPDIPSALRSFL